VPFAVGERELMAEDEGFRVLAINGLGSSLGFAPARIVREM
jgi:hypothetical protein